MEAGLLTEQDFQHFIDYWRRLQAAAGDVPYRSSLLLKDIPKVAPYLFLLEWHDLYDIKVRLLGTTLDDFLPTVKEGEDFLTAYEIEQRPFYAHVFSEVCNHPCGVRILRCITMQNGKEVPIRGVGLPLRDEDGAIRFLAGLVETPTPDTPLGFSNDFKRATSRIESVEYIDLDHGVPADMPEFPPVRAYMGPTE